jgi:hypothetical protein
MDQGAVQKATRKAIWEEHQGTVLETLPGVGQGIPQRIRKCSKRFIGRFRKRKLDYRPTSWRNYGQ